MSVTRMPLLRLLAITGVMAYGIGSCHQATAQLAPVSGAHYAARPSDTGFEGAVNSRGGYGASVPLNLPPAANGLSLPLQVVYGGKRVGAAGFGWDVPLSFLYHDVTIAHRRPDATATSFQPHERWSLTLQGENIALVRNAANTAWIAQRGHPQLEVRETNSEIMVMYDGEGRTYTFDNRRPAGGHLANRKLYLLTTIGDVTGNTVQLNYAAPDVALPNGGTGVEVDLTDILYNSPSHDVGLLQERNFPLIRWSTGEAAEHGPARVRYDLGSIWEANDDRGERLPGLCKSSYTSADVHFSVHRSQDGSGRR